MADESFDRALVASAFQLVASRGWFRLSAWDAAKAAGLDPAKARQRFPSRFSILLRLGELADTAVLAQPAEDPTVRERLFDLLMRRFDAMIPYREGIAALLPALPADPAAALLLACATRQSMGWILEAAGEPVAGCKGHLKRDGLILVWTAALRVFVKDTSSDLSATMAALDKALDRAAQAVGWFDKTAAGGAAKPASQTAGVVKRESS